MAENRHQLSFVICHQGRYRVSGTEAVFVRVCVTVKEEHVCNLLLLQRRDVQACHSEEMVVVRRGLGVGK